MSTPRHSPKVTQALDATHIPYRLKIHEGEITSLEQAAQERGLLPEQIVRTLLFRIPSKRFVVVLCPGRARVSWPHLRAYLNVSRITTASEQEVQEVTGYSPGAVSPFGLPEGLRLLADRTIERHEWISVGAGVKNAGVILRSRDLVRTLQPEMGNFRE